MIFYRDGASNSQGCRVWLILASPKGAMIEYVLWFGFGASNNEATYEALIVGLSIAKELEIKNLRVFIDS